MRRESRLHVIVGMFLILALYIALDRTYNEVRVTPAIVPEEMSADALASYEVVSADGAQVGPVETLIVDTTSASTHYVIVRLEDIYAFGKGGGAPQDRFLVIPWSHVQLDPAHHAVMLDVDAVAVSHAPTLDNVPNTVTPTWDREIRQYWSHQ